jgi:ATP-dependent RNA helicase RhlE
VLKPVRERQPHLLYLLYIKQRIVGSSKKQSYPLASGNSYWELAVQIGQSFDTYAKYTNLTNHHFGGVSQNSGRCAKTGIDILIATPGRLLDLHKQGFIDLITHTLVLDEADQMLDMGFVNDVKKS